MVSLKSPPTKEPRMTVLVSIVLVVLALTGCGAMRSTPDSPMSVGGLTPTIEDKEAGLVGLAPNFDIKAYRVIGVALFPVTDKLEDEGDRKFAATMAAFFNTELVRRLRESGQFQRVVNLTEGGYKPVAGEKMLRLEGDITRLGRVISEGAGPRRPPEILCVRPSSDLPAGSAACGCACR